MPHLPRKFGCEESFRQSGLGGADALARIPRLGCKGGGGMNRTRRPGMDYNPSATDWGDWDNRPGLERKPPQVGSGKHLAGPWEGLEREMEGGPGEAR